MEYADFTLFFPIQGKHVIILGDGPAKTAKCRMVERAGGVPVDERSLEYRAILSDGRDEGGNSNAGEPVGECSCCNMPILGNNILPLAILAFEDTDHALSLADRLRKRGFLVNIVDKPGDSDFYFPSILNRHPVQIAVGSGGLASGLSKHLRLALERYIPQSLGQLAVSLGEARIKLRQAVPDIQVRRRIMDDALREGGVLDPLKEGACQNVEPWVKSGYGRDQEALFKDIDGSIQENDMTAGASPLLSPNRHVSERLGRHMLHYFHIDPVDVEALSLRAARLLGEADIIYFTANISPNILERGRADAQYEGIGKDIYAYYQKGPKNGYGAGGVGEPCIILTDLADEKMKSYWRKMPGEQSIVILAAV